ncbi:adhesion domain-containing protein [Enterobacter kobei]|uniref:adhesion domain-containing protein n=1 Tax=Enterobacter kobei TaxID=208224 RepID=UPI0037C146AD
MGSRYDLVDRNNNIVLEYRKKEVIKLRTAPLVTGQSGERKSLEVAVTAKYGLQEIRWQADSLLAKGGRIVHDGGEDYSVILPPYSADGNNNFFISGIAYDKKGNASSPSETQISVQRAQVSKAKSQFTPAQSYLPADGKTAQILTLLIRDEQNNPVTVSIEQLSLLTDRTGVQVNGKSADASQEEAVVSAFRETAPGSYEVSVKAGVITENITLTPVAEGITLTPAKVFVGGKPAVKDLTIIGTLEVGKKLDGTYTFNASGGEPTDKSTFKWGHKGETAGSVGAGTEVTTSGTVAAYTLVAADAGEVMELSVQAKNGAAVTGNTITVDSTMTPGEGNGTDGGNGGGQVINPAAVPQVADINIAGTLEVGKKLDGTYTFNASGGEPTDKSTFKWGHKGETAGSVGAGTEVTTSGTVAAYTLVAADAGEVMELSVQAKNGAAVTGNTITVDSTMTPGEGNGTDGGNGGGQVINPAAVPQVADINIAGTLEVGKKLDGTYTFNASGGEPTDKSTFKWGHKGETAGSVGAGTEVTTSGTVAAYTLVAADAGEVMELSVQAKNGAAVTGNTITVDSTMTPGEGNGTDGGNGGGQVINPAAVPQVADINIAGTLEVGKKLDGTYTFNANNGEPTDKSTFKWGHKGETAGSVGAGTEVTTSGTVAAYTLVAADAGEVMELSVQAKNGAAVTGNTITVDSTMTPGEGNGTDGGNGGGQVINPASGPLVEKLNIAGTLEVGKKLDGTYTFNASGGEPTDKSTFKWGHKGETAGSVGAGTEVTTSGTVAAYTLVAADAGEVMELSVQAKNGAAVTGNTITVDSTMTPGEGNGTDGGNGGGQVINPAAVPQVADINIAGTLEVGKKLDGTYTFNANNGEPTDKSTFKWGHKGETAGSVGAGTEVTTSGTVAAYTLVAADAGEVMELSVQAKNGAAVTGNTITVDSTMTPGEGNGTDGGNGGGQVINPAAVPQVADINIAGTLEVGKKLDGTYTFNANNGEPTDKSTFKWGHKGETAGSVGAGTEVTTSGTVAAYTLVAADAGEVMELSVQAKNGAAVTGNTITVDSTMTPGEGNGTDGGNGGGQVINPAAVPQVADINIAGTLEVGKKLDGTYTFNANNGEPTDKSTFKWGHKGETAGSVGAGTEVTTSGTVAAYTLVAADAGEVMELSVQAKNGAAVTGNTITADTTDAVEIPKLAIILDKQKVKKGETIKLTVEARFKSGEPVVGESVTVSTISASNRQKVDKPVTATVNGTNSFSGVTDSNGQLIVDVQDNNTLGLETIISAVVDGRSESETQKAVIFTVITSPDTPLANYWGHMAETAVGGGNSFERPKLNAELTGTGTVDVNNETWARFTYEAALIVCPNLAPVDELEALGQRYAPVDKTLGWPAPTVPNPQGYRTSTPDEYNIPGHWNVDMDSGNRGPNLDTNSSFVACKK